MKTKKLLPWVHCRDCWKPLPKMRCDLWWERFWMSQDFHGINCEETKEEANAADATNAALCRDCCQQRQSQLLAHNYKVTDQRDKTQDCSQWYWSSIDLPLFSICWHLTRKLKKTLTYCIYNSNLAFYILTVGVLIQPSTDQKLAPNNLPETNQKCHQSSNMWVKEEAPHTLPSHTSMHRQSHLDPTPSFRSPLRYGQ